MIVFSTGPILLAYLTVTTGSSSATGERMKAAGVTDGKKTEVNQLIELRRAELNRVKADLNDELDKVNADAERLRAFNVSHR